MKNLMLPFFAIALTLLTACGSKSDNGGGGAGPVVKSTPSGTVIPANAVISDANCKTTNVFREAGVEKTTSYEEKSVDYTWEADGFAYTYSEDVSGEYSDFTKAKTEKIDETTYRRFLEVETNDYTEGRWVTDRRSIERVIRKEGTQRRVISNRVNGVEQPYYWLSEGWWEGDKKYVWINRHTNPSVRNTSVREYVSVTQTCTTIER